MVNITRMFHCMLKYHKHFDIGIIRVKLEINICGIIQNNNVR